MGPECQGGCVLGRSRKSWMVNLARLWNIWKARHRSLSITLLAIGSQVEY